MTNMKLQDGLLYGLTHPPGRKGFTGFWRPFFGTVAAAPGRSPSKYPRNVLSDAVGLLYLKMKVAVA